jgi:hypothetical protein
MEEMRDRVSKTGGREGGSQGKGREGGREGGREEAEHRRPGEVHPKI